MVTFKFHGQKIAIQNCIGNHLSIAEDGIVCWAGEDVGESELFSVLKAGEEESSSRFAFKSASGGKLLCVKNDQHLCCLEEELTAEDQMFDICVSGKTLLDLL